MAHSVLAWWDRLHQYPGGKWIFSQILSFNVPYTGTIAPRIVELRPGYAKVLLHDRRKMRNHLQSIHAVAQMNLAELVSGLAMNTHIPPDARGIVTSLNITFTKKARGTLTAESECPELGEIKADKEYQVISILRDSSGDVVSQGIAHWRIGPKRK